jgi:hypothetical protein
MNELLQGTEPELDWNQLRPLLDDAMYSLSEGNRQVILLRFFERHDFKIMGELLGLSEDAARMRVGRALEKLRGLLRERGVPVGGTPLAALLFAQATTAAPVGLSWVVSGLVMAEISTATATGSFALLHAMKMKVILASALAVALATTAIIWQHAMIGRLQTEQASLMERAKVDEAFRGDGERLAGLDAALDELSRLRREHEELARLRAEYAELARRKQMEAESRSARASAARASELLESAPGPFYALFATRIGPGQTMMTGGWAATNGRRDFLFVTPKIDAGPGQITYAFKLAQTAESNLVQLAQIADTNFAGSTASDFLVTGRKSTLQQFLDTDQFAAVMRLLEQANGTDVLTTPSVMTTSGQQGHVSVSDLADNNKTSFDVIGRIIADNGGVDLVLYAHYGFLDPSAAPP